MRRAKRIATQGDMLEAERVPQSTALVPMDPAALMELAIKKGGAEVAEVIERLTRLRIELQDREDKRELFDAVARFQADCPEVPKSTTANITGQSGAFTYSYADLEQIAETIAPTLRANLLAYSWDSHANDAGTRLAVTCTLRHANGQSVASSFDVPTESRAGMSPQQKFAAAQMFGRRKSLEQVLGLVARDVPDAVARELDPTPVTENEALTLLSLLDEVKADRVRFLAYFKIETLAGLPARRYGEAVTMLEQKRRKP